jgi:protein translocase SecG subunit
MELLTILYIAICLLLIGAILLQSSSAGVGGAFGGGDTANGATTRRGAEKRLLEITIGLSLAFGLISILFLVL